MASILVNYKSNFKTGTRRPDIKALDRNLSQYFDCANFVRSKETTALFFYNEMIRTQLFYDLIMNISFISELDSQLAEALVYFDECCTKVAQTGSQVLLDSNILLNDQTVVVLPPNETDSNKKVYNYDGVFPQLIIENFYVNNESNPPFEDASGQVNNKALRIGVRTKTDKLHYQKRFKLNTQGFTSKTWAFGLLSNAYALWFMYLPIYLENCDSKINGLNYAFQILVQMQKQLLNQPDEVFALFLAGGECICLNGAKFWIRPIQFCFQKKPVCIDP